MQIDGFDWDEGNLEKCQKHGVSLTTVERLFRSQPAIHPDLGHSVQEHRFRLIGRSDEGRWVLVAFTLRSRPGRNLIRPISARYMHEKEVRHYERQQDEGA